MIWLHADEKLDTINRSNNSHKVSYIPEKYEVKENHTRNGMD